MQGQMHVHAPCLRRPMAVRCDFSCGFLRDVRILEGRRAARRGRMGVLRGHVRGFLWRAWEEVTYQ
ncbi:hypothetical protein SNA_00550 [Streptomyces natalensis ATCC 27448]|uniref:Uncharacterized protein n=1 Tax=Streptomyces natalensis ATCC 27448 TaxID=1240678 RepID=A0A0D7CUJ9_9ACTN|nr:hypothetical protein SNA_00550 [Streptomyces natalensis ATCC 27448]